MNRKSLPKPLIGLVPPLVTPLSDSETLDETGYERLIDHLITGGVHGLFILGSTGEAPSLSGELRRRVIDQGCKIAAARIPVLVGVSDTCLRESIALAEYAARAGASAVVLCPPFYFPLEQRDLLRYFQHFTGAVSLPVFVYNIPKFARTHISTEVVQQLAEIPNVAGLKDSSGDLTYLRHVRQLTAHRPDFSLFIGIEEIMVEGIHAGANGAVCGGANLFPELHVRAFEAACKDRLEEARQLQELIVRISNAVYTIGSETSSYLRGLKSGLSLLNICNDATAEPFQPFSAEEKAQLRSRFDELMPLIEAAGLAAPLRYISR
jgi:4-hydroxy-tetrahydrodipicolinate synthase